MDPHPMPMPVTPPDPHPQVQRPGTVHVWLAALRPQVEAMRSWFLYMRVPYDRAFLQKYTDWQYLLLYSFAVSTNVLVRGSFFTVMLLCIVTSGYEESILVRFILRLTLRFVHCEGHRQPMWPSEKCKHS